MVVMVPLQYFQFMNCEGFAMQWSPENIILASCRSISRISQFFSWSSLCSVIMAVEFAVFLPRTKGFNVMVTYCGRAYSICDK